MDWLVFFDVSALSHCGGFGLLAGGFFGLALGGHLGFFLGEAGSFHLGLSLSLLQGLALGFGGLGLGLHLGLAGRFFLGSTTSGFFDLLLLGGGHLGLLLGSRKDGFVGGGWYDGHDGGFGGGGGKGGRRGRRQWLDIGGSGRGGPY